MAERNPYSIRAGEDLPVRLTYENRPLAGALVVAMNRLNPAAKLTKLVEAAFAKQNPGDKLVFHGLNVGFTFEAMLVAGDAFKRAKSTDPKALAEAIRQTNITDKMTLGGPIKFNAKGQVEGIGSACVQNLNQLPTVVLPSAVATAKPVFPRPDYKKT